ncbi:MAG: Ig-like domain repeat protein, partial [Acidimicrobiaceae bacterium]|nr:Ig-like domain repeat protein [Acidimicrobiaceae bacterium]
GSLPAGLAFHPNGDGSATIAGVATQRGNYPVTLTASNSFGATATQRLSVEVAQAPFMTTSPAATFTQRMSGKFTFAAGGWPVPTLSVEGSLPPGLAFTDNENGTATLSGTPTRAGNYSLNVTADNRAGMSTTQPVHVNVLLTPTSTRLSYHRTGGTATTATLVLTAVVHPPVSVPTGTVTFLDGAGKLGSAALDASGAAALRVKVPLGGHLLSASFEPSAGSGFAASTSASHSYRAVAPPSVAKGLLASTGVSLSRFSEIGGAVILLGAGVTALLVSRRRRPGRPA